MRLIPSHNDIIIFLRYCIYLNLFSLSISQFSVSTIFSSNYGSSKNDYNYFDNYLDVNLTYGNWSSWLELEYSDPTMLGKSYKGFRKGRIEYYRNNIEIKIGDIYEFWGNGLSLNSVDDKTIDLDTGIRGAFVRFPFQEYEIDLIAGKQRIWRSTNLVPGFNDRIPNYESNYDLYGGRIKFNFNKIDGGAHILYGSQNDMKANNLSIITEHSLIGANLNYFSDQFDVLFEFIAKDDDGFGLFADINIYSEKIFFSNFTTLGLSYKNYLFSSRSPDKRWDIVNEKKGTIPFQQMPTVFQLHSSVLLSRVTHILNYNDEVGFNLYLKTSLSQSASFLFTYSRASRNNEWRMDENYQWYKKIKEGPAGDRIIFPVKDPFYNPFQETFFEMDGYLNLNQIYYKIGISKLNDVIEIFDNRWPYSNLLIDNEKNILRTYSYELKEAFTLPFYLTYRISDGRSIDFSFEYQDLKKGFITYQNISEIYPGEKIISEKFFSNFSKDTQINRFISIGYSSSPKWSINLGIDYADTEESIVVTRERHSNSIENILDDIINKKLTWINLETAYNFNESYRLILSYGSKRGGVYCSNGVCRYIQPFENGFTAGLIAVF